jgi:tRNA(His) 5'-end guanylyltransferase
MKTTTMKCRPVGIGLEPISFDCRIVALMIGCRECHEFVLWRQLIGPASKLRSG